MYSHVFWMRYLALVYFFTRSIEAVSEMDNETEDGFDDEQLDDDIISELVKFGNRLFGEPDKKSGDMVKQWSPESKVNPEEVGTYVEGDILHPAPTNRNGLRATTSRWPNGVIPYEINPYFRPQDRQMIQSSISDYERLTCLKFIPRSSYDTDYIYFNNGNTGCWSSVGRIGGRQEVNLQSPGCLTTRGTVMHEMMHAAGFMHEQNRPERDNFVTIRYENIEYGRENNFEKASSSAVDSLGVGYDYKSVMHYSSNAFSKNGQPTIQPKVAGTQMGQREGLSERDIKKIRKMYGCDTGVGGGSGSSGGGSSGGSGGGSSGGNSGSGQGNKVPTTKKPNKKKPRKPKRPTEEV